MILWGISQKKRQDSLIGGIDSINSRLNLIAGETRLDPRSSSIISQTVNYLKIKECSQKLTFVSIVEGEEENFLDSWITSSADIQGNIPKTLYHGTTDTYLEGIRTNGLITDGVSNWEEGGQGEVYLTATPQIAAFHARRTARNGGGNPIVIECNRPRILSPDWDVVKFLVENSDVPSNDGLTLAQEAGLFASRTVIPANEIVEIRIPLKSCEYRNWTTV